jgi:hypothetical protein
VVRGELTVDHPGDDPLQEPEQPLQRPLGDEADLRRTAYSEGGYGLLIKTIQRNVFPGFRPNHIIDTNFTGFSDLVDAIGCVYSDVDRRYYNQSAPGLDNFSSIDIQPGYQKLCGDNQSVSGALPFVRYRHTDLVRSARQQDFIRWAKDQYPISRLIGARNTLLRIFGTHSTLDTGLQSEDGIINLFNLVLNADGNTIRQIRFPANLQPCTQTSCIVTANQACEQQAYARFIAPTPKATTPARVRPGLRQGPQAPGRGPHRRPHRRPPRRSQSGGPALRPHDAGLLPAPDQVRFALLPERDRQLHGGLRAARRIPALLSAGRGPT